MFLQNGEKIGYALGGGAARGLSHIGVLKVLDEYKISPDIIVGTSMGAIVGALYASGLKANDIADVVLQLDWRRLVRLTDMTLPISGIIQGKRVVSLLKSILGDITFANLKFDFACVAADIITGEQVVLHDGSLIDAVRASISIPGIFTPVMLDGRYLVDGGLVNEVPVSVCRVMGAKHVIGVNVLPEPGRIMCNPKNGRSYPACELVRIGEIKDKRDGNVKSEDHSHSLSLRLNDIQNAIVKFVNHQSPEKKKLSKYDDSGLNVEFRGGPFGVSVWHDGGGNDWLWVTDYGNNRVLKFALPVAANGPAAALVVGQPDLATVAAGTTQAKLSGPVWAGVPDGQHLVVADNGNNRYMVWNAVPGANGANASLVIGQTDFVTATSGTTASKFSSLWQVAGINVVDGYLVLPDSSRLLAFDINNLATGMSASKVFGQPSSGAISTVPTMYETSTGKFYAPTSSGVYYDPTTDRVWLPSNYHRYAIGFRHASFWNYWNP